MIAHAVVAEHLALEREALAGPRAAQDLHGIHRPRQALGERDAEHAELLGTPGDAEAERQPALAELVDDGRVLGQPQGIVQRRQDDAGAQPDPIGGRGEGRQHRQQRGQVSVRGAVVLAHPGGVEAQRLGEADQLERVAVLLRERPIRPGRHLPREQPDADAQRHGGHATPGDARVPTLTSRGAGAYAPHEDENHSHDSSHGLNSGTGTHELQESSTFVSERTRSDEVAVDEVAVDGAAANDERGDVLAPTSRSATAARRCSATCRSPWPRASSWRWWDRTDRASPPCCGCCSARCRRRRGACSLFGGTARAFRDRWRLGYVPQRPALGTEVPATVEEIVTRGAPAPRAVVALPHAPTTGPRSATRSSRSAWRRWPAAARRAVGRAAAARVHRAGVRERARPPGARRADRGRRRRVAAPVPRLARAPDPRSRRRACCWSRTSCRPWRTTSTA